MRAGIWHEAELVIYNQTEKLVDARFGLRASAAFPRLEVNGAVDGALSIVHSSPYLRMRLR